MSQKFLFSIVIPVYNEGELILQTLMNIHFSVKNNYEILICYDFENDNTISSIVNSKLPMALKKRIQFVKNVSQGPHSAVMTGLYKSIGTHALVIPADDSINSKTIHLLFKKAQKGYDIVCPSRFIKGGFMKGAPFLKSLINRLVNTLLYLSGIPSSDATNGFRLFSRRVINNIEIKSSDGFIYSMEYLIKAYEKNYTIAEYPSKWVERNIGQSRFTLNKWWRSYLKYYLFGIYVGVKKRITHEK